MQHSALDSGRKISQFAPPLSLTLSLSAGRFGPAIKSDNPIKYRSRFLLYRTVGYPPRFRVLITLLTEYYVKFTWFCHTGLYICLRRCEREREIYYIRSSELMSWSASECIRRWSPEGGSMKPTPFIWRSSITVMLCFVVSVFHSSVFARCEFLSAFHWKLGIKSETLGIMRCRVYGQPFYLISLRHVQIIDTISTPPTFPRRV